jgi:hypothetical protein
VAERPDLEIHQYVAAKEPMVKYQVDKVVLIAYGDPFLSSFNTKASAQFQEERRGLRIGPPGIWSFPFSA